MSKRYERLYLKPNESLLDSEATLRKIIIIDNKYYAIIMIGVVWDNERKLIHMHPDRCIACEVKPNGELYDIMYNILLTTP